MDEKLLFEVITTFCELPNGDRDVLKTPYDGGDGYIYGTNGKVFIAVPKELLPTKGQMPERPSKAIMKVVKFAQDADFEIPLKELFKRLKKHPGDERCPECKGKKQVTWTYFADDGSYMKQGDCPVCNGTGLAGGNPHTIVPGTDKPVNELACVKIKHGGVYASFFAPVIAIVANGAHLLGRTALHVVRFSETGCMLVTLPDGIFIGGMPCVNQVPDEVMEL